VEAAPAGHARAVAEFLRQPLPGDAGGEHEQDPGQDFAVVEPSAAGVSLAARWSRQQRLEQLPELVIDQARHRGLLRSVWVVGAAIVRVLGLGDGCVRELRCREL